ncbi:hypothetical protein OKW48_002349 [Paraburkholderia youngii]
MISWPNWTCTIWKRRPMHARAAEQLLHLFGRRVGRDVEVFRLHAEQQVAHRAADDERAEARLLQALGHADRVARDQRGVDAMHVVRNDDGDVRFARRLCGGSGGGFATRPRGRAGYGRAGSGLAARRRLVIGVAVDAGGGECVVGARRVLAE